MKRLTTDNQDHILAPVNLFYAKDNEVWVRGGGPEPNYDDTSLVELIHRAARTHGLNITADEPEPLGDEMYDALFDGVDTVEGIVALLHTAAIQATEMRHRLMCIEDILGDEYDLAHLRELAQADREGRVVVLPCKVGESLWVHDRDGSPREMMLAPPDIRCHCAKEDNLCMALCDAKHTGICARRLENDGASIGKTVFLTREEAEAALEAQKDGGVGVCPGI